MKNICGRKEHPPKSTRKQKAENLEENPRDREAQRQQAKKARDAKARDARQKQGQASKPARQRFARLQRRWAKRVVKVLDNPASSKLKTKYSRDAESFTPEVQELFKSIREELKQNRKKHLAAAAAATAAAAAADVKKADIKNLLAAAAAENAKAALSSTLTCTHLNPSP